LKKNLTETGSNRPVSIRFGFLGKNRLKPVWLGFSGFGSVYFWFFVGFGSVRLFWFFAYKTETELNQPVFSKI
jgi:hypothetical protein